MDTVQPCNDLAWTAGLHSEKTQMLVVRDERILSEEGSDRIGVNPWNAWLEAGWIVRHKSDAKEIAKLLKIADRDLADSQVSGLSTDAKLGHAYHAVLQSAAAALAASGFRATREDDEMRVLRSLSYTIGLGKVIVEMLDAYREKRHKGDQAEVGLTSELEANEMVTLALRIRQEVESWLRRNHLDLLP